MMADDSRDRSEPEGRRAAGWPEEWWAEDSRAGRDLRWRQARMERRGWRHGPGPDHEPDLYGDRPDPWGGAPPERFEPPLGDPYAADPPVRDPPNIDPSPGAPPTYDPADLAPEWPIDDRLVAEAPPVGRTRWGAPGPRLGAEPGRGAAPGQRTGPGAGLGAGPAFAPPEGAGPPQPPAGDPLPGQPPSAAGPSRPRPASRAEREQWLRDYIDREQRFRLYFAKYIAGLLGRSSRSMRFWLWLIDDGRSQKREEAAYLKGTEEAGLIPALRARRTARRG